MNNTGEDNYHLCVELGRKGDWDSLNRLMGIYLNAEDSQTKKDARKALRKAYNRKAVIAIIYNALEIASSSTAKLDILQMGIFIERSRFLYDYFVNFRELKSKINKQVVEDMKLYAPFSPDEQSEIVRYMADSRDFSIILFRELQEPFSTRVKEAIVNNINNGLISYSMFGIIGQDHDYIRQIQDSLRMYIQNNPDNASKYFQYLDLDADENRRLLNASSDIFSTYRAISRNDQGDIEIQGDAELVRLAIAVKKGSVLSEDQWGIVKQEIERVIDHVDDVNRLDSSFYVFLRALVKIDQAYVEKICIILYEKSEIYSGRILNEMIEMHLAYAYRVLTQRLLTAKNTSAQIRVVSKLIKNFPEKCPSILEYIQEINNDEVTSRFYEFVNRHGIDISKKDREDDIHFIRGQKFTLIDRNTVISELISQISSSIHATTFYAAVGFAYSSGLKMLRTTFKQILNNGGNIEIILGSLQNYGSSEKNSRIDRATVSYLNQMLSGGGVKLFTYPNSFYHGKFYYIANDEVSYIILGSSNISKTAYLSNYELDSLFKVFRESQEDLEFTRWYRGFRSNCDRIDTLDETQFDEFDWKSEHQAFGGRNIKAMSLTEVNSRITNLTDEETKLRLKMWMGYNPTEVYSNLEIQALDDYIVFLYEENGLAVFESFVTGNAYYTFRYDDFDRLLSQLSGLSKTKMLLASEFLMRGYHIQDKDRLEGRIAKLFSIEE